MTLSATRYAHVCKKIFQDQRLYRQVAHLPEVLAEMLFFYNRQSVLRETADVVGCHIFAEAGWFMKGRMDEITGGRRNHDLETRRPNGGQAKPFESHFMFARPSFMSVELRQPFACLFSGDGYGPTRDFWCALPEFTEQFKLLGLAVSTLRVEGLL